MVVGSRWVVRRLGASKNDLISHTYTRTGRCFNGLLFFGRSICTSRSGMVLRWGCPSSILSATRHGYLMGGHKTRWFYGLTFSPHFLFSCSTSSIVYGGPSARCFRERTIKQMTTIYVETFCAATICLESMPFRGGRETDHLRVLNSRFGDHLISPFIPTVAETNARRKQAKNVSHTWLTVVF